MIISILDFQNNLNFLFRFVYLSAVISTRHIFVIKRLVLLTTGDSQRWTLVQMIAGSEKYVDNNYIDRFLKMVNRYHFPRLSLCN